MRHFVFALFLAIAFFRPSFAAAGDKILDVQKLKTPAGIEVWLVEDKTVPVISMTFSFDGGLVYDPADKPGVGRLASILLDEGADQMTSQEFQSQLSNNAIQMSFSSGRDAFHGQLKTLKSNEVLAFDLLRLALNKPRFDADAIERMRNANISQIKDDMGDPGWLVARTYNGMVFEGHAYAQPGFGNLDSMQRITRKDLVNFVHAQFARNVLKVALAGDITKEEAAKAVDDIFGALPDKTGEAAGVEAPLNYAGKTILLPLDAPQTYISAGEAGIKRDDKDWHAAVIMNYILGGSGFDARLMKEIREKRGLTYGIYSNLTNMKHADLLQANMSASNEKVAEALKLLKQEWAKMAKDGPTDQEVQDAKSYLTGSLLLELTSTDDISETLNGLQRDGLDFDYINQRNAAINAVSVSDIKRVAAKLLKPENLTVVLVGQPANVTADIMLDHAPGTAVPEKKQ
ncbi:MAG: insulinase family protein [Alphaproteobacteria bacterium]|nr:insulinase family protein [Alphaproteobacteria bacterium]